MPGSRLRIIVTGLVAQYPLGGVTWDYLQYPLGLARMGHDVYYLEDSGQWPYSPVEGGLAKQPDFNVGYLARVMERFGLGYEALREIDPGLIYLSISGFGSRPGSPYADWPAYAPNVEAMSGLYEPTRKPGQPPTVVPAGALVRVLPEIVVEVVGLESRHGARPRKALSYALTTQDKRFGPAAPRKVLVQNLLRFR